MLQTADYARAVFTRNADLHKSPRDTEAAVRGRLRRQEGLYDSRKRYHILMWEGASARLEHPTRIRRLRGRCPALDQRGPADADRVVWPSSVRAEEVRPINASSGWVLSPQGYTG
ncbi:Scr1 family TA system antitoxin-like transcriptional regulator [Stenotrophomonas sp. NPDC087984]